MSLYTTIGFIWVVFTSAVGSIAVFYAIFKTAVAVKRQLLRGQVEENLDIKRAVEAKYLERMVGQ